MKSVADILGEARRDDHCVVEEPRGLPVVAEKFTLPADVAEFYRLCGGLDIYPAEDWGWRIFGPAEFVRADPFLLSTYYQQNRHLFDGTRTESLYAFAVRGCGPDYLAIDTDGARRGLIYDSYVNDYPFDGMDIMALSFTEILNDLFYFRAVMGIRADKYYGKLGEKNPALRRR